MPRIIKPLQEDWDFLIVLDACRFDAFQATHSKFFRGNLEQAYSLGSATFEWVTRAFPERRDDIVYISSNPYINSKKPFRNYNAIEHFHKIIDVWDWGWDNELGTVHPAKVNEVVRKVLPEYPTKKLVIHYLQPHAPYLGTSSSLRKCINQQLISKTYSKERINQLRTLGNFIRNGIVKVVSVFVKHTPLGDYLIWKTRELLRKPPASYVDAVRRCVGIKGLREAYYQNLEYVLSYVNDLTKTLSGKVIITSDHGELLGEKGHFTHIEDCQEPLLRLVPWFSVEEPINQIQLDPQYEKIRISKIIQKLKRADRI